MIEPSSRTSADTRVNLSWIWAMRSKFTVLERRSIPTTS